MIGFGVATFGDGRVRDHISISAVCAAFACVVLLVSRGTGLRGIAMTIDDRGLWYRDWDLPAVPWRHVSGAWITGIRLRPLVRVDLRNAESFFATLDGATRRKCRGNVLIKDDHLLIPGNAVEGPISMIATLIRERLSG